MQFSLGEVWKNNRGQTMGQTLPHACDVSSICVFTLHSLSQLKLPGLSFRGLHPIAIGLTYDNHPSL